MKIISLYGNHLLLDETNKWLYLTISIEGIAKQPEIRRKGGSLFLKRFPFPAFRTFEVDPIVYCDSGYHGSE